MIQKHMIHPRKMELSHKAIHTLELYKNYNVPEQFASISPSILSPTSSFIIDKVSSYPKGITFSSFTIESQTIP